MNAGTWRDELTGLVRLYGQGRATGDAVLEFAARVWATEGDDSEPQGQFVVRQLLGVAGQATVDEDRHVFEMAKKLIGLCPDVDQRANSAEQILRAFANVQQSGVAIRAVKDSYRRHFP